MVSTFFGSAYYFAQCVLGDEGTVCLLLFDLDKHYDKAVADLAESKWKGSR